MFSGLVGTDAAKVFDFYNALGQKRMLKRDRQFGDPLSPGFFKLHDRFGDDQEVIKQKQVSILDGGCVDDLEYGLMP